MGRDLDEVEREVVQLLREKRPLRFTDIVQSLSAASRATSPKLSRRLKHLVDLGVIRRQVTNDWPPRALYLVNIGAGQTEHAQTVKGTASEPDASSKPPTCILTRPMGTFLAVPGLAFVILALSSILLPGIGGILVLILVGACLVWIGLGFDTQPPGSERYLGPIRGWATGQAAKGRFTVCGFIAAGISAAYMVVGIANRLLMPATLYPHRCVADHKPNHGFSGFRVQSHPPLRAVQSVG